MPELFSTAKAQFLRLPSHMQAGTRLQQAVLESTPCVAQQRLETQLRSPALGCREPCGYLALAPSFLKTSLQESCFKSPALHQRD